MADDNNGNSNKGFASMSEEERSKIASEGGKAAQASGHAHKLTDEERSEGGSNSGGNFKNDPQRASEVASQRGDNE